MTPHLTSIDPNARTLHHEADALLAQIERLVRSDPARRGLISSESQFGALCPGHLAQAAAHLAEFAQHVGIVTGFYVPDSDPPAAETDGPLGSALLAAALESIGVRAELHTDHYCANALTVAARGFGLPADRVVVHEQCTLELAADYFDGPGKSLTHLIAVERVGPSHTTASMQNQVGSTEACAARFGDQVPAETHDRCHNVRGRVIDEFTVPLHRLFEELPQRNRNAKTIGVGDGGNEIGMGGVPWSDLVARLDGEHAPRIPCRISTDWTIVAGASNWGAYALAAAALLMRGKTETLRPWGHDFLYGVLKDMVEHGPAVDGMTRRREPTVDGLPFITYIQPWEGIRRVLGLDG